MEQQRRKIVRTRRVDEVHSLDELMRHCLPAFGGAYLRRIYSILDTAIGMGCPLTVSVAGPVTVSGQHQAWLIPLLETGWIAYVSTTDAVCYHDGHRALPGRRDCVFEVPIFGDDGALREQRIIRVADMAFDDDVLNDQDRFLSVLLRRPEFQKRMSGTELRYKLGLWYGAMEKAGGAAPGLLSTCARMAIPVFVGAPGDGSVFLNSLRLWAMREAGLIERHDLDLDIHLEVFESCAFHYWGLFESETKAMGTIILGGGVPKNFNLQPEPALSQLLGLPEIRGYLFDVQIVSAPVTDGSLSSCFPAEAVTWGKVDKDHYQQTTESMQCDYSIVLPLLVKALLENRSRYERMAQEMGEEALFREEPKARGYLRPREGYRLYDRRAELVEKLKQAVREQREWLLENLNFPLPAAP
jgi:deoxyhypusine synthase